MYKLTVRLDTDNDFKFKNHFINSDTYESTYVFDNREDAIYLLMIIYNDFKFKASDEYLYIINAIVDFKEYLIELSKRYQTFRFIFNFGNCSFEIELIQYHIVDNWTTINDSIFYNQKYIEERVNIELYLNKDFKNKLNIEDIKKLSINYPIKNIQ